MKRYILILLCSINLLYAGGEDRPVGRTGTMTQYMLDTAKSLTGKAISTVTTAAQLARGGYTMATTYVPMLWKGSDVAMRNWEPAQKFITQLTKPREFADPEINAAYQEAMAEKGTLKADLAEAQRDVKEEQQAQFEGNVYRLQQ